jgi:uncharacterized phiE125 gp8 family phage protein
MRTFVVTPPAPVVTWAEADAHLKLDGDENQRVEVEDMIAAATGTLDGPDGWLGRALGIQTLEARFDAHSCSDSVRLLYPPVIELLSVSYLDNQGVLQAADLADFELLGADLVPMGSQWAWSGGSERREAVRVQYRAGYAALPFKVRSAILLMVADLYRFRETATVGMTTAAVPMSTTVENLLSTIRVYP